MIDITVIEVARFGVMFFLLTLMGASFLLVLKMQFTRVEICAFGAVLGMATTGVGLGIAHITSWKIALWAPHLLIVSRTLPLIVRRNREVPKCGDTPNFLFGVVCPIAILIWSVFRYLPQLTVPRGGAWYVDTDVQFLLSIGSESMERAPTLFPSAATSPLGYTWLFSGTMGNWAQLTGSNIFETTLVYWPFVYSVLMPVVLALTARILTGNNLVASISPLVFVMLSGQLMSPGLPWIVEQPIFMNSPHRDFATLFFLTLVGVFAKAGEWRNAHKTRLGLLTVVFVLAFMATGSKGSLLVLLGGGFVGALLVGRIKNLAKPSNDIAYIAGLLGVLVAQFLIVGGVEGSNARPKITWLPQVFSFTPGYGTSEPKLAGALFIVSSVLWSSGMVAGVLMVSRDKLLENIKSLLIAFQLVSVFGSFFIVVSGSSQMYLVQSMRPLGTIFVVMLVVQMLSSRWFLGIQEVVACLTIFLVVQIAYHTVEVEKHLILVYLSLILIALMLGMVWGHRRTGSERKSSLRYKFLFGLMAVAVMQIVKFPNAGNIATPGDQNSRQDIGAVSTDQIASLIWLRKNTTDVEIGISNKHCSRGTLASGCSHRWFLSSAISERRFLIEGLGYVSESSLGSNQELLELSDRFINNPNELDLVVLRDLGVTFAYIDRREPHDEVLKTYCRETYVSELAIACLFT